MTNVLGDKKHRPGVIPLTEFQEMHRVLESAEGHPYYVMRNLALVCLLWLTGKRAAEVAGILLQNMSLTADALTVGFVVGKKRTIARFSTRMKDIPLNDPYAKPVLDYYKHMLEHHPDALHLFPSTRYSNHSSRVPIETAWASGVTGLMTWSTRYFVRRGGIMRRPTLISRMPTISTAQPAYGFMSRTTRETMAPRLMHRRHRSPLNSSVMPHLGHLRGS